MFVIKCSKHPEYRAKKPSNCTSCNYIYLFLTNDGVELIDLLDVHIHEISALHSYSGFRNEKAQVHKGLMKRKAR